GALCRPPAARVAAVASCPPPVARACPASPPRSPPPLAGSVAAFSTSRPSRCRTATRFTSGNASHGGTTPARILDEGAWLYPLTPWPTPLANHTAPRIPQPLHGRDHGQQGLNLKKRGRTRIGVFYACSVACSLNTPSASPSKNPMAPGGASRRWVKLVGGVARRRRLDLVLGA